MARSCSIWTPVLISLSPITGESPKFSRRRVILATSVGSHQVRTIAFKDPISFLFLEKYVVLCVSMNSWPLSLGLAIRDCFFFSEIQLLRF